MKKISILIMLLIGVKFIAFSKDPVPQNVNSALTKKFPNASDVKWDKENAHEFEASFQWNGNKYSANFNDKGEWLETEFPLTFKELPEAVQRSFNTANPGQKINAVSKIESSKNVVKFEIEVMKSGKVVELFYKVDGSKTKE